MKKQGQHCFVSGHVQGVFYRDQARRKAAELGITGWVRNLPDGRVEAMAFGDPDQLETFVNWLWEGPSAARVDAVDATEVPWEQYQDFTIRY